MGQYNDLPYCTSGFDSVFRTYLEKYKTCASAEEVAAMQDTILAELENSYEESRRGKDKGLSCIQEWCVVWIVYSPM